MGRVEAIWKKRTKLGPMDAVETATLIAGEGIAGNADYRTMRQVTILDADRWREAEAELGREVDPRARRANLMLAGIDLEEARGRTLAVGDVRLRVRGETRPCERMDEACEGLQAALAPRWRAGAWAEVVAGGEIAVGDEVAWVAPPDPGAGATR